MPDTDALNRNATLYPWYAALYNAFFWMPVFFLYFSEHLTLGGVLTLESIYYASVVLLEVPSGYASDAYGRRRTLLISSTLLVGAYLLFFWADGFAGFAVAQVALAGGIAFQSGTGTSFHYDSLAAAGQAEEYEEREGIVTRNSLAATALAAVLGGAAGIWGIRWAYALSALTAGGALLLTLQFVEPSTESDEETPPFGEQLVATAGDLKDPVLLWLFAYAVVMTMLNHVPYEFYQPYLELAATDIDVGEGATLGTGLHMGITTLIGAFLARRGVELDKQIGTGPTLLAATALQLIVICGMAALLHPAIALLIFLRGLPKAIATAPLRAAVTPRLNKSRRATYLSLQSLVGRLSFAGLLVGLGSVAGTVEPGSWPALSRLLWICGGIGLAGFVGLAATRGWAADS